SSRSIDALEPTVKYQPGAQHKETQRVEAWQIMMVQDESHIVEVHGFPLMQPDQDIATLDAGLGGGTFGIEIDDRQAAVQLRIVARYQLGLDRVQPQAELAPNQIGQLRCRLLDGLQNQLQALFLPLAVEEHRNLIASRAIEQSPFQVETTRNLQVAHLGKDIANLYPRPNGRTAGLGTFYHQGPDQRGRIASLELQRRGLPSGILVVACFDQVAADQAVPGAVALADTEHIRRHTQGAVHRDGEADSLGPCPDRHVDANQLAVDVQERAARVAGVNAGVGLNERLV